jgi:hypothetical protein
MELDLIFVFAIVVSPLACAMSYAWLAWSCTAFFSETQPASRLTVSAEPAIISMFMMVQNKCGR